LSSGAAQEGISGPGNAGDIIGNAADIMPNPEGTVAFAQALESEEGAPGAVDSQQDPVAAAEAAKAELEGTTPEGPGAILDGEDADGSVALADAVDGV
jgi:hypothetical protein